MSKRITYQECFATWLIYIRKHFKLNQGELAKLAHVSQSLISSLESGRREIRGSHIQAILDALNMDPLAMNTLMNEIQMRRMVESSNEMVKVPGAKSFSMIRKQALDNASDEETPRRKRRAAKG